MNKYGSLDKGGPERPGRKEYQPHYTVDRPGPIDVIHGAAASQTDNCIPWPFGLSSHGYGRIMIDRDSWLAHRLVLTLKEGPPAESNAHAAHDPIACSGPSCINPRHLRWTSAAGNAADRTIAGTEVRGVDVHNAVLTPEDVVSIRASSLSNPELAKEFGVAVTTVRHARIGKTWAWLE